LCVSQQGEFKNTTKTFWGKSMSKTLLAKKVENFFFVCHKGVLLPLQASS
jgi:hypothetical protein